MVLQVCRSAAGWYLGTYCNCGPYSRESIYFKTEEEAGKALRGEIEPEESFLSGLQRVHPLVAYSAENLAAIPLRVLVSLPVALVMLFTIGRGHVTSDPVAWLTLVPMLALAWAMTFLVMCAIGSLAFFFESAASIYEVWLGLFTVFSGYLFPLSLMPDWLRKLAHAMPFRLMMGLPVETMLGSLDRAAILEGLLLQLGWTLVLTLVTRGLWKAGLGRYAAFGG